MIAVLGLSQLNSSGLDHKTSLPVLLRSPHGQIGVAGISPSATKQWTEYLLDPNKDFAGFKGLGLGFSLEPSNSHEAHRELESLTKPLTTPKL